jgi:signal recognition particle receptor subunit alpha
VSGTLRRVNTNFQTGVQAKIQTAMESSLRKILTPTSSLDLLREIDAVTSPSAVSLQKPRPYVISIVGVNGVGKSTNLSKICFFLLQNKYKVLIVAGDTFRSGAVEQLAVHVRNLKDLTAREGGGVELYEKGYGKDAANVAKDAIAVAAQKGYDVVLIDTAGRRHNDQVILYEPYLTHFTDHVSVSCLPLRSSPSLPIQTRFLWLEK